MDTVKDTKLQNDKAGAEMSLDEVLSSIKEMVIGEEPPVLELTNIVAEDKESADSRSLELTEKIEIQNSNGDMKTFLQMAQSSGAGNEKISSASSSKNATQQEQVLDAILQKIVAPIVENWVRENLPRIAGEVVEKEIKKVLKS